MEADVARGQKTGFFLDRRENRRQAGALAAGRRDLNLFIYTGGFSLYAAGGGAAGVCSVDMSERALAGARRHFELNRRQGAVARCEHETARAECFCLAAGSAATAIHWWCSSPPALAKRESERAQALGAYAGLMAAAMARVNKNGILLAASCSARVSAEEFFALARQAARKSGRKFEEFKTTRHAPDRPAAFAEARSLKCITLRFLE